MNTLVAIRNTISRSSNPARWGLATAIVVAVVVGAAVVLGGTLEHPGRGLPAVGAAATATPSPSPSPVPSPTPSTSTTSLATLEHAPQAACGPSGPHTCLAPGTYRLSGDVWPAEITMQVPAGWFEWLPYTDHHAYDALLVDAGTGNGSGWGLEFNVVGAVAKDPCDPAKGTYDNAATATVDGVVSAMSRWPGFEATAPAPTVVGGYSGQLVELTSTRTDTDCPDGWVWTLPQGGTVNAYPMVGARGPAPRTGTFRIVDVNGTLLVIRTTDFPETSPNELAQGIPHDPTRHVADQVAMRLILDSIRVIVAPGS